MARIDLRLSAGDYVSEKKSVLLVSRAFALLLITWALVDATYLPERIFALSHHMALRSALATHDYWSSYYWIVTFFHVLRMLGLFLAASLFWKCGPRVEALLYPQQDDSESPT
jgi:hypothetical protein